MTLENKVFTNVIRKTDSYVKKLEYTSIEGDDFNDEGPSLKDIEDLIRDHFIEFINFLSGSTFVSLRRHGVLSIKTDDDEELLRIIEVLTSEIN